MTQFIAVITKDSREQIERYLYSGNDIVSWETAEPSEKGRGASYAVVEAKATNGFAAPSPADKADKVASGLIWAEVFEDRHAAIRHLQDMAEANGDYIVEGDEENPDDHPLAGSPV